MTSSSRGKGYLYFDIPKQERDSAIAFLLDALLKSKIACRFSPEDASDEDVNIYLAHLLFAAALPDYQKAVSRYLTGEVSDLTHLIEKNDDRIVRYFIYKVNADHLMVHLGIFGDLEAKGGQFAKTAEQYASMAKNYYEQAANYNRKIYRRPTAIGSVLEKLSRSFPQYKAVLQAVRKEFFHFTNHFNDQDFGKFVVDIHKYEKQERRQEAMDAFLDAYASWIETREPRRRQEVEKWAKLLRDLDPAFQFDWKEAA